MIESHLATTRRLAPRGLVAASLLVALGGRPVLRSRPPARWPPNVVPPQGAPNVLLVMTDDAG